MREYAKAVVNILLSVTMFLLVWFLLPRLLVLFAPFVAGWLIAQLASPVVNFFEKKIRLKRKAGSAFVIIAVIGLIVFVLYLLSNVLIREGIAFAQALPGLALAAREDFDVISEHLQALYDRLPAAVASGLEELGEQVRIFLGDLLGRLGSPTLVAVGNLAKYVPTFLIGVVMALLSSYFFVADREEILGWLQAHVPGRVRERALLIRRSVLRAVGDYFRAQLRIEIWMYLLLVLGLWIMRVGYVWLIALGIAFLDFLPFFGTGTVMIPWALVKLLSGDLRAAAGLLIVWGVGQLARQIIQPKIVGDSIGMPPLPTLFLLYLGYRFYGVIGMIVSVPAGLILISLYREGAFDTTKESVLLIVRGISRFRQLSFEETKE